MSEGPPPAKARILEHTDAFERSCVSLGDPEAVDRLVWGIAAQISTGAEKFPFVLEEKGIRVAKSKRDGAIPPLNIFFRIKDEDHVEMLWAEENLQA